ncbi:MAG: DUF3306 domain-containing protein [Alphaproteobacteria bacterium]
MADRDAGGEGEGEKGFLKRWSRRKLEDAGGGAPGPKLPAEVAPAEVLPAEVVSVAPARQGQTIAETGAPAGIEEGQEPEAQSEEPFDPAELPDIDSLDKDSDYTGFLKDGVPAPLRHLALQKLFRSDPALAVLDGLNDYDEDFTLAKVAEKIISSYKPGRGYVDDEDDEDGEDGGKEVVETELKAGDDDGDGDGGDGDGDGEIETAGPVSEAEKEQKT